MFEISRDVDFCYGHRLLHHQGKCRFLHGHNGRVRVTLRSQDLNEMGMVTDFGDIRATLEAWILEELDHRTLLCRHDPLVEILRRENEPVVVFDENPTAENIAKRIYRQAEQFGLPVAAVTVWETPRSAATYTP